MNDAASHVHPPFLLNGSYDCVTAFKALLDWWQDPEEAKPHCRNRFQRNVLHCTRDSAHGAASLRLHVAKNPHLGCVDAVDRCTSKGLATRGKARKKNEPDFRPAQFNPWGGSPFGPIILQCGKGFCNAEIRHHANLLSGLLRNRLPLGNRLFSILAVEADKWPRKQHKTQARRLAWR